MFPQIRAARIAISDSQGRDRIIIGLDADDQPQIQLFHDDGHEGASLALTCEPDAGHLRLGRVDRGAAAHLLADSDGHGDVEFSSSPRDDAAVTLLRVEQIESGAEASLVVSDPLASSSWVVGAGGIEYRGGRMD